MKALVTLIAATLYFSPRARSWFGELLFVIGLDLMNMDCEPNLSEEELARGRDRLMRELEIEQARRSRNGDRP